MGKYLKSQRKDYTIKECVFSVVGCERDTMLYSKKNGIRVFNFYFLAIVSYDSTSEENK